MMIIDDKSKVYGAYFGVLFFTICLIGMYNKYVKKSEDLELDNSMLQLDNYILGKELAKVRVLEEKKKSSAKKEGDETIG